MTVIEELVRIKHSKRAKRVALRLDAKEGVVNLVVPPRMKLERALNFARKHEAWVKKTLSAIPPPITYQDGAVIPLNGKKRVLEIDYDKDLKRTSIVMNDDKIQISTNKENPTSRIERFIKSYARKELTSLTRAKAKKIGKPVSSVSVRDTKSRWGSCSDSGKISYSWRLIFAPTAAMDYVVAHEVSHLVHMDHSNSFWNLCRELSVDFLEGQYWMRNNGNLLLRYGRPI